MLGLHFLEFESILNIPQPLFIHHLACHTPFPKVCKLTCERAKGGQRPSNVGDVHLTSLRHASLMAINVLSSPSHGAPFLSQSPKHPKLPVRLHLRHLHVSFFCCIHQANQWGKGHTVLRTQTVHQLQLLRAFYCTYTDPRAAKMSLGGTFTLDAN